MHNGIVVDSMTIVCDIRENLFIQECSKQNVDIQVETLDLADFKIIQHNGQEVLVERKTMSDLSASIVDGRYKEQKQRLMQSGVPVVYIIENTGKSTSVPMTTLLSAILKMQYRDKLIVVRSNGIKETLQYVKLIEKLDFNDMSESSNAVIRKKTHESVYIKQLCCIPGVSLATANKISDKFPNLNALMNATQEDLMTIEKIGPKLSKSILAMNT